MNPNEVVVHVMNRDGCDVVLGSSSRTHWMSTARGGAAAGIRTSQRAVVNRESARVV